MIAAALKRGRQLRNAPRAVKVVPRTAVVEEKHYEVEMGHTLNAAVDLRRQVTKIVTQQRVAVQARRGSYRAAMNPRTRVQTPWGGSGDQQLDMWSRRMLRELSRDLDRNADTFRILNDAFASAVVGKGVQYRPMTKDDEWNKLALEYVHQLMLADKKGVDYRGVRCGYKIQYDLVREYAVDGEMGFLKLSNVTIQPFESEQVTNGGYMQTDVGAVTFQTVDGVNMDAGGRVTSYHICPFDALGRLDYGDGTDYSVKDVEWCANRARFSQTRGTPLLVACLEDWERLDSYRESEIIAAEQGSQIYGVIKHQVGDLGTGRPFAGSQIDPGRIMRSGINDGMSANGYQINWQPTVAGAILDLPDGKDYVPIDPKRPNPEAVNFLMELLRQFCANSGLPYEWVYNDVRGLSWSVHRGLVQMARDRIAIWQTQFFGPIFRNFYTWLVGSLIDDGRLPGNPEWRKFELDWPQISWPDEGAEYEAQANGLLKGLTTRHRVYGAGWRGMIDERMIELEYAAKKATDYNAKYPDFKVTPQFVLGFEDSIKRAEVEKADVDATDDEGNLAGDVRVKNKPAKKGKADARRSPSR